MMDWLGKLLSLPPKFLATGSNGRGGGVIQVPGFVVFILLSEP